MKKIAQKDEFVRVDESKLNVDVDNTLLIVWRRAATGETYETTLREFEDVLTSYKIAGRNYPKNLNCALDVLLDLPYV